MQIFQPQQPLLWPYVNHMIHMTLRAGALSSVVDIPTGHVFLSLFLGETDCIFQSPSIRKKTSANVYVASRHLETAHLSISEKEMQVIGIKLPPNAIHQFFGVPQQETTGCVLTLEDLWGPPAGPFYQQVIDEPDPLRQLALVEDFLCRRVLSKQWKENATIDEAVYRINQCNGNVAIPDLAHELRISVRGLERRFRQAIGISPKAYCNVIRFNHAFRQFAIFRKHVLDLVSETGYYDQPHFVHHFRKVVGKSPSRFREEQDQWLYCFGQEAERHGTHSLVHALADMQKLYLF